MTSFIAGALLLAVANVASFKAAARIVGRLALDDDPSRLLAILVVRLGLISLVLLLAGVAGALNPVALGLLAALSLLATRGAKPPALPRIRISGPLDVAWAVLAILLVLRLVAQVWVFAPHNTDVLSYHLPKVAEWIRAGRFTAEEGVDSHASLPSGFQLLELFWCVFLRHDVLVEMAGAEFLAVTFAATALLASRCGLGARAAAVAGLAAVSTPGLNLQATSGLNDGAVAAMVVATAAFLVGNAPRGLGLLAAGLGLGLKPTFAFAAPGLLLLAWVAGDFRRPWRGTSPLERALALAGAVIGLWWYARNAAVFGNPFHPVTAAGFARSGGGDALQFGLRFDSFRDNLADFVAHRLWDREPYGAHLDRSSGWGLAAVAVGLPALAIGVRDNAPLRWLTVAFSVSVLSVFAAVRHDAWYGRFVLFAPALAAVAAARLADGRRRFELLLLAGVAAQGIASTVPSDLPWKDVARLAGQPWSSRSAAPLFDLSVSGHTVAYLGGDDGQPYLLYGPDFSRRVVYLRETSTAGLEATMRQEGAGVLAASADATGPPGTLWRAVLEGRLRATGPRVYALEPAGRVPRTGGE